MKTEIETVLERHTVDIRKVHAEFREASARRHVTSYQEYHFDNNVLNRAPAQKILSIYNWNPGRRRGKEGAIEKQISGKLHVIALHEAIEYFDHEVLTNRFHVTHYGGSAVLFNMDTFLLDIKIKSISYTTSGTICRTRIFKKESGLAIQGVISRASFRRELHGLPSMPIISVSSKELSPIVTCR